MNNNIVLSKEDAEYLLGLASFSVVESYPQDLNQMRMDFLFRIQELIDEQLKENIKA